MRLDINELAALFHIHAEATKHGPAFKNIRDAAWKQLKAMDDEHAEDGKPEIVTQPEPEDQDAPSIPQEATPEPTLVDRRV